MNDLDNKVTEHVAVDEDRRMTEALAPGSWVMDGNIGRLRDLQLPHITTLVWLDYPLHTCMSRLFRRTLRHVVRLRSPGQTRSRVQGP